MTATKWRAVGCVMRASERLRGSRLGFRLMLAAGAAALLAGCADSTRLADPFSNPFGPSAKATYDPSPTGAIKERPAAPATSTRIESRPLAAPSSAPASQPVAPQPVAPARLSGATSGNWTAEGGASIVVGQGETASMLSTRYGVPTDALLKTNGLASAAEVQPGSRIVVPVYRPGAGKASEPKVAEAKGAEARKVEPKPVARAEEKPAAKKENLRFVKGPEPAGGEKAARSEKKSEKAEKAAKADPARPTKELAREAKKDVKAEAEKAKAAKAEADKAKLAKAEADKQAKADAAKERQRAAEAKRQEPKETKKVAAEAPAKPEPRKVADTKQGVETKVAETRKPEVDSTPTASLPPTEARSESKSDSANPEFRWPARGRIIQGFKAGGNDGINIAVPEGTAVKAAESGVVAYAGSELKGYGNLVLIRHPNGFVSAYAHNGSLDVKRGDQVKRGQTIAKAGQTGNVSTPQVHFELRKGSSPVDPTNFLAGL